ncbi:MAG: 6-carboxytetrahydropterin synthase [Gemmatimonadales bacterium]|nr:MAG: 6-carboxytetrahydropterin synthase [Gemmatimonadales bacterium]
MNVSPLFELSVAKESLGFSAAHFLTLSGHICERLHGHNYRLGATVEGPIDPKTGFVIDFAVLKNSLRALSETMDHRVLIPADNPALTIHERDQSLLIDYLWPEWLVVPRTHACLLPLAQTTAECLAGFLAAELWKALRTAGETPSSLMVEVEESHGQSARCRIGPDAPMPD